MKKINYIFLLVLSFAFFACSPDAEIKDFGPAPVGTISASAKAGEANVYTYRIDGDGAFMYNWRFANGVKSQEQELDVYFPFKGTYENFIYMSGRAGTVIENHELVVPATDPAICEVEGLILLTGGCEGNGKKWTWNQDEPGGDVSYMTAPYDWDEFWWNPYPGDDGVNLADLTNEIKFDLNGAYNFTRYETPGEIAEEGSFVIDLEKMVISFIDANIPNYDDPNLDENVILSGTYLIKELTEDKLVLWQDHSPNNGGAHDYAWTWEFKAVVE